LGGIKFGCTHSHGRQNLIEAIAQSCNVYFYQLAMVLGEEQISRVAKDFGLGSLTHIDLPYERSGLVPNRRSYTLSGKRWYAGHTLNLSIGQGDVLSTPLQLVKMMATIANSGEEVQPHLIKDVDDVENAKYDFKRVYNLDKEIFNVVNRSLRAAVENYSGTAHTLNMEGITIAGKTGTAQSSGGQEHHAWFVGYVEHGTKKWAFCVFLEHGGSSQNATLLARQLLQRLQQESIL
jgi:penicillin-binding protein 2